MISQFLVYIQGGLGSLFPCLYLSGGLTLFGEEEKQQKEGKHILHLLRHPYLHTCLSFLCHVHPHAGVWILLVLFFHFHNLQITGA